MPEPHLVTLSATDGVPLAADLHLPPDGVVTHAVVIAPAMAVKRRYYSAFSAWLAEGGAAVIVPDYRGIGGSGHARTEASMVVWGERDLPAAAAALRARYPDVPLLYVGHSAGGQLFGLQQIEAFAGVMLVASGSGYWRHYAGWARVGMWAIWHVGLPLLTRLFGYLPMRRLGQGEDVPKGVAHQWATWGRHPRYVGSHADAHGGLGYTRWTGPLRAYAVTDDSYAPPLAVAALVALYPNADAETITVTPASLGVPHVGHFGFFRPAFRDTLWVEARAWLHARAGLGERAPLREVAE
jgi:predicted alpha/beta hydrolase